MAKPLTWSLLHFHSIHYYLFYKCHKWLATRNKTAVYLTCLHIAIRNGYSTQPTKLAPVKSIAHRDQMGSSNSSTRFYLLNILPKSMGYLEIVNTFYFFRPFDFHYHETTTKESLQTKIVSCWSQFYFAFNLFVWNLRIYFLGKNLTILK